MILASRTWLSHSSVLFPTRFCSLDSILNAVLNPICVSTYGLASSDFARHYFRNLGWFLFLALLRCFSSGGSPHIPIYSVYDAMTLLIADCSIRTSADQHLLAIPRSFSQLTASFFGSQCQGILPALLLAWPLFSRSLSCFLVWIMLLFRLKFFWNCSFPFDVKVYLKTKIFSSLHLLYFFIQFSRFKPLKHFCLWWAQMDSNHRPHAYQACALTTWAMRPFGGD